MSWSHLREPNIQNVAYKALTVQCMLLHALQTF